MILNLNEKYFQYLINLIITWNMSKGNDALFISTLQISPAISETLRFIISILYL